MENRNISSLLRNEIMLKFQKNNVEKDIICFKTESQYEQYLVLILL